MTQIFFPLVSFSVQNARRFLSLQVSQASHVLSDELNNILKSSKTSVRKRRRIIDEIFSTEQSYQEHLHLISSVSKKASGW